MGRLVGIVVASVAALALVACGSSTTTVVNNTTTVTESAATSTAPQSVEPEFSGSCPDVPIQDSGVGAESVEVGSGSCEYAESVAKGFAEQWGPDCYKGCTVMIEGIRCEYGGSMTVECFAAGTEVRFTLLGGA